ncbi:MAG TPA: M48 family metallopeptidase [Polyangia bacterium]|jgi:Zn-dependent protease with chaperone function|nr:M48 family metallopeptidase [Polyangia bacterium]
MLARDLRTSRERTLYTISAIFSALFWLAALISIAGIVIGLFVGALALVVHCLFMAHVIGNGVRVGPRQLPDLMRRIEAAAHKLGMDRVPEAYLLQAGGLLNAFATKLMSRRFIIIYSDLLEASDADDGSGRVNELDFVIGHELGHLAAGHLASRLFLLPARILPLLGSAYSRACEYTCDRCGHAVTGDLDVSSRALAILAAGPRAARRIDLDAFVDQRRETGRFWMGIYELNATHPFLSKRVAALRSLHGHTALEPVRRNPFSYLLAVPLSLFSGGPQAAVMILVIYAGAAAAIAIPRLKQQMGGGTGMSNPAFRFDPDKDFKEFAPPPPERAP